MKSKSRLGEFVSGAVTHLMRDPSSAEPSTNLDIDGLKKALERHSQTRRIKALEEKLKAFKASKVRGVSNGGCELVHLLAAARRHFRKEGKVKPSAVLLAQRVDLVLGKTKEGLRGVGVCPKSWHSVKDLPRLLSDALKHPELKRRAVVLISKAR